MKIFLFISAVILLTSCVSLSPIVNFIDYSAYNDDGIFLTESNSVNFTYEPVGSVQVLLYSSYRQKEPVSKELAKERKMEDAIYGSSSTNLTVYQGATASDALNLAVNQAKKKGANAIINLKCDYFPAAKNAPSGWVVSGMAIRK